MHFQRCAEAWFAFLCLLLLSPIVQLEAKAEQLDFWPRAVWLSKSKSKSKGCPAACTKKQPLPATQGEDELVELFCQEMGIMLVVISNHQSLFYNLYFGNDIAALIWRFWFPPPSVLVAV